VSGFWCIAGEWEVYKENKKLHQNVGNKRDKPISGLETVEINPQ
jgi:hypothetical protein